MALVTLAGTVAALLVLAGARSGEAATRRPRVPPAGASEAAEARINAQLEARTGAIFVQLRALTHIAGPLPDLEITQDPLPKAVAQYSKVIVTRRLLRLCASVKPATGKTQVETRDALIAFVLAHELEHLAGGDPGSFGSRTATGAVERDADDKAAGRLVVAGIEVNPFQIADLLAMIGMESGGVTPLEVQARARAVNAALKDIRGRSKEWHVGWMLTVAGRFDQALEFYTNVAGRYPYAIPMYTLAITRLQTAWRIHPCSDPLLLEWLPPLRYDPRSQIVPFQVRGPDDACDALRQELDKAAKDLARIDDHPAAMVALAAIRLMHGDEQATIDPTRDIGGVKGVGIPCPPPRNATRSRTEADACHVSLLAQYEMSRRSPESRAAAIEGLEGLRREWPSEPSLPFNLARLLSHAGRHDEARLLWSEFLQAPGNALHRQEAETALRRQGEALAQVPAEEPLSPPAPEPRPPSADRLRLSLKSCRADGAWKTVSSSSVLTYCGDWTKEIAVRNREGAIVRSIALGPTPPSEPSPPTSQPLFVTMNDQGEDLRIWADEAWIFDGKTPRRVVYFKRR